MKKVRQPDPKAGAFAVCLGATCLLLVIFVTASAARKYSGAACGISLLAWGISQIAAAKKNGGSDVASVELEPQSESLDKFENSGSMHNVLVLFGWIFLFVVMIFVLGVSYLFLSRR